MSIENEHFSIRGHHLGTYRNLFMKLNNDGVLRRTHGEIAQSGRVEQAVEEQIESTISTADGDFVNQRYPGYRKDVVGSTSEEEEAYRQGQRKVLLDFLTLPDDYPVKMLANKPDEICKTCLFGKHCTAFPDDLGDELAIQGYFGLRIHPGEEIPLKEVRWTLSQLARIGHY